jgi:hypothetical protein
MHAVLTGRLLFEFDSVMRQVLAVVNALTPHRAAAVGDGAASTWCVVRCVVVNTVL